jgi:hydrogenase/urease accessory protein HupE
LKRLVFLLWLLPVAALAHELRPSSLELTPRDGGRVDVVWRVAFANGAPMPLEAVLPERCKPVAPPVASLTANVRVSRWTADCGPEGLAGGTVRVGGLDRTGTDVLVRVGGTTLVLRADAPEATLPSPGEGPGVLAYLPIGVEHILLGTDHLLFVLGLLLLVGQRWRALLWTVTAFTLAHSVTLVVAALGWMTFPTRAVEAVIALSILLLAVELSRPAGAPPSLAARWPWVFALVCGLLHGLGFAGALSDVGLPADDVTAALVLFNVGVELGQLAFVALASLVVRGSERSPARRFVVYAMGGVAAWWLFDRAAPIVLEWAGRVG